MVHIRALFIISPRATKITGPGPAVVLEWLNHQPAGFARRLLASVSRWKPPKNRSHRFRPPPPAAPGHVEGGHSVRQALGKLRSAIGHPPGAAGARKRGGGSGFEWAKRLRWTRPVQSYIHIQVLFSSFWILDFRFLEGNLAHLKY